MPTGKLLVHFLNVGHGDCTIIKHPSGRLTVIDSSNGEVIDKQSVEAKLLAMRKDARVFDLLRARGLSAKAALREMGASIELTNPVEFLARKYPGEKVFRYIQTHPEMDHMRGLAALLEHQHISGAFWDTKNDRDDDMRDSDKADWGAYRRMRNDSRRRLFVRGNDNAFYGSASEYDKIEILSPTAAWTKECNDIKSWNDMSIVVRVTHNGASFVFGGDAESPAWEDMMLDPIVKPKLKNVHVLKASHHGRVSGYNEKAVTWMSPGTVIMSIGEDCEHEAVDHYKKHTKQVLSTYDCGDITMTVDELGKVTYSPSILQPA